MVMNIHKVHLFSNQKYVSFSGLNLTNVSQIVQLTRLARKDYFSFSKATLHCQQKQNQTFFTSDKEGGKCFCLCSFVCLSVSKISLLKNACMGLDEMLHVDRCRDMDKLINF